jgi:hypothetical protein
MKDTESASASSSAATSATAPPKRESDAKPNPKPDIKPPSGLAGESAFLAAQAEDAKLAMARAWEDLKHALANGVDIRLWTKRYPWLATSGALAGGVALGYLLTPRDKDEFKEMWEKLKERLSRSGASKDDKAVYVEATTASAGKPQQPSLLQTILREAIKGVVPLVTAMASAGADGASQNGHGGREASD